MKKAIPALRYIFSKRNLVFLLVILVFAAGIAALWFGLDRSLAPQRARAAELRSQIEEQSIRNEEQLALLENNSKEEALERAAIADGWIYPDARVYEDTAPGTGR
ncbi:MAG: hypothetical protein K6C36_09150 [Clostridia bacterium]|nr:hypothetical protein [Clostridia bacterium]